MYVDDWLGRKLIENMFSKTSFKEEPYLEVN
jgi:hypothetical protein